MKPLFEHRIAQEHLTFKYARGTSSREGKEIHPFHEILYFVDGEADFISERERLTVPRDTLIIIPKETFHQFTFRNHNSYERYVFNFTLQNDLESIASEYIKHISILHPPGKQIACLCQRLGESFTEPWANAERQLLVFSVFTQILLEIRLLTPHLSFPEDRRANSVMHRALLYINQNCYNSITVGQIAQNLNISPSSLSHLFKDELGVSVYQYIMEKRLAHAHHLISENTPPTQAYLQCGFNDYSSFYRAYRNMFGKSPSA